MINRIQIICLALFSMLYISIPLCAQILLHKPIMISPTIIISAGSIVAPLWFVLADITAEIYGYNIAKDMFYCMMIVDFVFCFITVMLFHLPSPIDWNGQLSYGMVIGALLRQYFADLVGFFAGGFINVLLITKWKILLQGRYFWLRSIGASITGETIFTALAFFMILYNSPYGKHMGSMIFWGIALKLIANIILAFPASLLVFYLEKTGYANISSTPKTFNPFLKND